MKQMEQLLAELDEEDVVPAALHSPPFQSIASAQRVQRPLPPALTTTTAANRAQPQLLQQQQEAMATLR